MELEGRGWGKNMDSNQETICVLMLPWLGHGHISPYLELAKRLVTRNFHIYLCSTPINFSSIKKSLNDLSSSIQLVELHIPSSVELPPQYHTTNGLPPHLMPVLKKAFDMSANPIFSTILENLNPDLLIYDFLQPWAADLASFHHIPAVEFVTYGAAISDLYFHFDNKDSSSNPEYPFSEIYLTSFETMTFAPLLAQLDPVIQSWQKSSGIVLIKSFREIEGKFMDHLSTITGKKVVPVGPLIRDPEHIEGEEISKDIFEWLDGREPLSTVLVSFGTEYFSSGEEVDEIAKGLDFSNVNFIWVIGFHKEKTKDVSEMLPEGFLERVSERGFITQEWVPQVRILGHPSIGGFVSHCGWSSVMESLKLGVPIIAMPMHIDQPVNSRLLVALGLGLEIKRDDKGRYMGDEIAKVIKKAMNEEDGKWVRNRVNDMRDLVLKKADEDIEEVVKELVQICREFKRL